MKQLSITKLGIVGVLAALAVTAYVFAVQPASAGHNADGLQGYWALDDGADPTADLSSHGNDGDVDGATYGGDTAPVPGNVDALSFDGVDDVVTVPDASELDIEEELTISFWFKLEGNSADGDWPRVVSKGQSTTDDGAYGVFIKDVTDPTDIGLRFIDSGGTTHDVRDTGLPNYDDDSWHHVAATYSNSGDVGKLYVDGVEEVSVAIAGDVKIASTADDLTIGAGIGDADRHFNGDVDEVRIYDRALSADEVEALNDYSNFTLDTDTITPAFNPVGDDHSVSVTIDPALAGIPVTLEIDGPNSAESTTVSTDGSGAATLDYTSDGTAGLDTISVCVDEDADGCDEDDETLVFEKYWLDSMIHGGGHILDDNEGSVAKRKDWDDVSFGGFLGDAGTEGLIGDWTVRFHNVGVDTYDKTTFHATSFTALSLFDGNGTVCDDAFNFTALGTLDGEEGWSVIVRGGDLDDPASQNPDTLRVQLFDGGDPKYDTLDDFPGSDNCVGTARTKIDAGNLVIEQ